MAASIADARTERRAEGQYRRVASAESEPARGCLHSPGRLCLRDEQYAPRHSTSSGSVFSFLGLDPLSNLDPAVRQLAQARQLAERALFYGQRTPQLVVMETQRLVFALAVMPESMDLLQNVGRLSVAAQQTSTLAAGLPEILAKERAATIEQLTGVLDSRQTQLQGLIVELRSTLEAGTATSDSLKGTIASLDTLMARFERPESLQQRRRTPATVRHHAIHRDGPPTRRQRHNSSRICSTRLIAMSRR